VYLKKLITIRINKEVNTVIQYLMNKYPNDYPSAASVLRSGVFVLKRMKDNNCQKDA